METCMGYAVMMRAKLDGRAEFLGPGMTWRYDISEAKLYTCRDLAQKMVDKIVAPRKLTIVRVLQIITFEELA